MFCVHPINALRISQIDSCLVAKSQLAQLQSDISELRLRVPSLDALRDMFVTNDALKVVAGELQVRTARVRAQFFLLYLLRVRFSGPNLSIACDITCIEKPCSLCRQR